MSDENKQHPCPERPCQSRPYQRPATSTSPGDPNAEVRDRPILYTGVIWIGVLRRFLNPRTCGSVPPADPDSDTRLDSPEVKSVSHFSEPLSSPLSSPLPAERNLQAALLTNKEPDDQEDEELRKRPKMDSKYSSLAVLVKQVQEASVAVSDQVQQLSHDLSILMSDGRASTTETIETIRAEDAVMYRYGVIGTSGFLGYLMGLRRGTLVRLVYCATGITAMASVCYPEEAKWYNTEGLKLARDCLALGLSLIKEGTEVLSKESITEPKCSEDNENENFNQQKESPRTDNKVATDFKYFRNKFGTLGHSHDQPTQSSADSRMKSTEGSSQKSKESEEVIIPPQKPEVSGNHPPSQPSSNSTAVGKLSSQCETDLTSSLKSTVPYSPALPSPPKVKPSYNQPMQNGSEQTTSRESADTKEKSSFHAYSAHDSLDASFGEKESSAPKTEHFNSDLNSHLVMIPTPEPEMIIVFEQESSGDENFNKAREQPLNKKLSRYYDQVTEENISSIEKEYDDLYSKRE